MRYKTIWENFVGNWKRTLKLKMSYKTIWENFVVGKKFRSRKYAKTFWIQNFPAYYTPVLQTKNLNIAVVIQTPH